MPITSFNKIYTSDQDTLPMYQKIKEHILEKIALGEWKPQQKIPSENEIATALQISRMTVNRAFKELTEEGYLFREKGAGTFVAEPFQLIPFFELMPISEEIAIEGHQYTAKIIRLSEESDQSPYFEDFKAFLHANTDNAPDNTEIAAAFFYSEILYFNQNVPIQFEKRYVLKSFAPQYSSEKLQKICSTSYLQTLSPTLSQQHTLEAIVPDAVLQNILQIEAGVACFKVEEILQVHDKVISYAEQYYPASRYKFHSKIS